jgi:CheY-like chemotaxis protein
MDQIERIMIVDDDEEDREFFAFAVHEINPAIECIEAINGEHGLQLLNDSPLPWCIFLDLNMPRINGLQFLTEIKKTNDLKNIPVIIYSTSKLEKDKEKALSLGAVHVLTKPDNLNDMKKSILFVFERGWEHVNAE